MEAKKYTVGTTGPKIEAFLRSIAKNGGFQLQLGDRGRRGSSSGFRKS